VMLVKPLNLKKDCSPQSNRTTQRTDRIVFFIKYFVILLFCYFVI
jgi:hypothetical protein